MSEEAAQHHDRHHGGSIPGGGPGGIGSGIRGDDAASVWDERYRTKPQMWSGKPNPQLVREAGGLKPGKALDLGCGEGADAIWLAQQGWTVTAVDVSAVALERAQSHENTHFPVPGLQKIQEKSGHHCTSSSPSLASSRGSPSPPLGWPLPRAPGRGRLEA